MTTKEIVKNGVYSNGKGRIRKVLDVGDYPLYSGQRDRDCVLYEIINDGTRDNRTVHHKLHMTRNSFAKWATDRL